MVNFLVKNCFAIVTNLVSIFTRKTKSIVICLQNGMLLTSNTRALLAYYNSHPPDFKLMLASRSRSVDHKYQNVENISLLSFKGIYYFSKAKVLVITHGAFDFFPLPKLRHQTIINMWHGIPLKKIGGVKNKTWDYHIVSSEWEQEIMHDLFKMDLNKVKILGIPKTDSLFKSYKKELNRTFLYLPTFRDQGHTILFPFKNVNLKLLNKKLQTLAVKIKIKFHPNESRLESAYDFENLSQISFIPQENNLEMELKNSLGVITDYSGVVFDAIALNLPIIFIPYDIETYSKERGFLFDFDSLKLGRIVDSQSEFIKEIGSISRTKYPKKITSAITERFYKHTDGGSSQRTLPKLKTSVKVPTIYNFDLFVDPSCGQEIYDLGFYEVGTLHVIKNCIDNNDILIDVGASLGLISVFTSSLKKKAKVLSFEPQKERFNLLSKNKALNNCSSMQIFNNGLGNENAVLNLHTDLFSPSIVDTEMSQGKSEPISILILDEVLEKQKISSVKFIKIDVEGFEFNVLKGASKLLASESAPILCIEYVVRFQNLNADGNIYNFISTINHYKVFQLEKSSNTISQLVEIQNQKDLRDCDNLYCFLPWHIDALKNQNIFK